MPIVSGGGGGPASGSYLPVANAAGATLDSTTYADPVAGSGFLRTLVFVGDKALLAVARSGDAFPRWIFTDDARDGIYMGNGTYDPYNSPGPSLSISNNGDLLLAAKAGALIDLGAAAQGQAALAATGVPQLSQVSPLFTITSGALPTVQLVTATGAQISTTRDVETVTPCTFNPGVATTATVTVALSSDNSTFTTLGVETEPVGTVFDGTIRLVKVRVPAGWYLKLTVNAQAVLGLTTYY